MINAYEIRFFQVGSASKGGDAILIMTFPDLGGSSAI